MLGDIISSQVWLTVYLNYSSNDSSQRASKPWCWETLRAAGSRKIWDRDSGNVLSSSVLLIQNCFSYSILPHWCSIVQPRPFLLVHILRPLKVSTPSLHEWASLSISTFSINPFTGSQFLIASRRMTKSSSLSNIFVYHIVIHFNMHTDTDIWARLEACIILAASRELLLRMGNHVVENLDLEAPRAAASCNQAAICAGHNL